VSGESSDPSPRPGDVSLDLRDSTAVFSELWSCHGATVERFVRRKVVGSLVDDVMSLTMTTAWERIDLLDDDPRSKGAVSWLYAIASHAASNVERQSRRRSDGVEIPATMPSSRAQADLLDIERRDELRSLMHDLTREQQLLLLAYAHRVPAQAVGEFTGMKEDAVTQQWSRLRRRIAARTGECDAS
jgi:RNA polymerase sigma factor (sigma-70 family)